MEIIIDGIADIVTHDSPNDKLTDIIEGIKKFVFEHERALLSINIDDKLINNEESKSFDDLKVNEFKKLEIQTCPKKQLSGLTLKEINTTLPKFKENFEQIAILVQERKIKTALEIFIKLIDEWQSLQQAFKNALASIQFDVNQDLGKGITVNSFINEFSLLYNEITESFENNDWILLADLLEYEISPKIDDFIALIKKIIKQTK